MAFTQTEKRANTWRDIAGILGSTLGGIGTGAAIGNIPGAIIGGVAGLGMGVAGTVADKNQRSAAEEEQERLEAELKSTEAMSDRMAEVGASQANLRRSARADAESQAARSGMIGGAASDFVQKMDRNVAEAQAGSMPAIYGQAKTDERARRQQLLNQEITQQSLLERQAEGGAMNQIAGMTGNLLPMAMEYKAYKERIPAGTGVQFGELTDEEALAQYDDMLERTTDLAPMDKPGISSQVYAQEFKTAKNPEEVVLKPAMDYELVDQIVSGNQAVQLYGADPFGVAQNVIDEYHIINKMSFDAPEWAMIVNSFDQETRSNLALLERQYRGE